MLGWWWLLLAAAVVVMAAVKATDDKLEIHFIQKNYTVREGDGVLEVKVRVRGEVDPDKPLTILVTSRNDTATAGVDFQPVNKSITIASEADYPIKVHIIDDNIAKGSRRFNLTLALKSTPTCTITILEDDKVCVQFNQTSYSVHRNNPLTLSVKKIGTINDTVPAINVTVSIDRSHSSSNRHLTFREGPKEPPTQTVTFSDISHVGNFTAHLSVRPSSSAEVCNNSEAMATVEVTLTPEQLEECAKVDCDSNAECINASCVCNDGFTGDGTTCEADRCGAVCDYIHGWCVGGHCVCNDGYILTDDGTTCTVDECDAKCEYTITACDGGDCVCKDGYTGDGKTCEDIDECQEDNNCDEGADCKNTPGSFDCFCKPGYSGDGTTCEADECGAKCDYTNGRCDDGDCVCNNGYVSTDEGKTCEADKCGAKCEYTHGRCGGGGRCVCNDGYILRYNAKRCEVYVNARPTKHSGSHTMMGFLVTFSVILVLAGVGYIMYHNREKIKTLVPRSVVVGGGKGWRYHVLPQSMHNTD